MVYTVKMRNEMRLANLCASPIPGVQCLTGTYLGAGAGFHTKHSRTANRGNRQDMRLPQKPKHRRSLEHTPYSWLPLESGISRHQPSLLSFMKRCKIQDNRRLGCLRRKLAC